MADREKKEEAFVHLDLGGLFGGIGDLTESLSGLVEGRTTEVTRTGKFRVKGLDKAKGIYGLTVRVGLGGIPTIEHFGNIHATEDGPVVAEEREPLVDVFDEGDMILVVAELPGVEEEEIQVRVKDDVLSLSSVGDRKYTKEILLSSPVDPATMETTYRNGVLELRLRKQQGSSG